MTIWKVRGFTRLSDAPNSSPRFASERTAMYLLARSGSGERSDELALRKRSFRGTLFLRNLTPGFARE